MTATASRALLSVDVEDWFQVENLRAAIPRESWAERESRVERNMEVILDILDRHNTRGTFFVLGWIAERFPKLVQRLHAGGHEIASHGYGHELIYRQNLEQFREDAHKSKQILEDIIGERILGYRAPSFSITDWAIPVLIELGFTYDSSLFPSMAHDRYGRLAGYKIKDAPMFELVDGFHEVLLSCLPLASRNIPWAGGGYFRLLPYPVFRRGMRRILAERGVYCFYIHPWEFDPGQPKIRNIKPSHRFRHYNNLDKTEARFAALVREFQFQPIRTALREAGTPSKTS
jgi:polysaccharide deacetylase family protein (PEP-CTERM system associated)